MGECLDHERARAQRAPVEGELLAVHEGDRVGGPGGWLRVGVGGEAGVDLVEVDVAGLRRRACRRLGRVAATDEVVGTGETLGGLHADEAMHRVRAEADAGQQGVEHVERDRVHLSDRVQEAGMGSALVLVHVAAAPAGAAQTAVVVELGEGVAGVLRDGHDHALDGVHDRAVGLAELGREVVGAPGMLEQRRERLRAGPEHAADGVVQHAGGHRPAQAEAVEQRLCQMPVGQPVEAPVAHLLARRGGQDAEVAVVDEALDQAADHRTGRQQRAQQVLPPAGLLRATVGGLLGVEVQHQLVGGDGVAQPDEERSEVAAAVLVHLHQEGGVERVRGEIGLDALGLFRLVGGDEQGETVRQHRQGGADFVPQLDVEDVRDDGDARLLRGDGQRQEALDGAVERVPRRVGQQRDRTVSFRDPALEVVGERVVDPGPQVPGLLEIVGDVEQWARCGVGADAAGQVVLQRVEVALPGGRVVAGVPVAVEQARAGDHGAAPLDQLTPDDRFLPFPIGGDCIGARRKVVHADEATTCRAAG